MAEETTVDRAVELGGLEAEYESVREWYIAGRRTHNPFSSDATLIERFDRWLAAHDAERAEDAIDAFRAYYQDENNSLLLELPGWAPSWDDAKKGALEDLKRSTR